MQPADIIHHAMQGAYQACKRCGVAMDDDIESESVYVGYKAVVGKTFDESRANSKTLGQYIELCSYRAAIKVIRKSFKRGKRVKPLPPDGCNLQPKPHSKPTVKPLQPKPTPLRYSRKLWIISQARKGKL